MPEVTTRGTGFVEGVTQGHVCQGDTKGHFVLGRQVLQKVAGKCSFKVTLRDALRQDDCRGDARETETGCGENSLDGV